MKPIYTYLYLFLILFNLTSCETVVDLDLPTAPPRLVVEGNLDFNADESVQTEYAVKLTLTTGYYETEIPKVHNATVWVEDASGTKYPFVEQNNSGIYTSTEVKKDFINNTYKLFIEYNNDLYEATDVLAPTPEIIDLVQTTEKFFTEDLYVLRMHFQDTERAGFPLNYYFTNLLRNDAKPALGTQSNEFSKGMVIESIFINSDFEANDKIAIEFQQISRNYYDYMNLILDAISNGGGPFQTPIAKIKGNVKNVTTPDKEALGFFRVTEKRTITHIITE